MKLLANAHISRLIFNFLPAEGHDCVHAELVAPGMPDDALLGLAVEEHRVIITADKDSGELVFRRLIPAPGMIVLRLHAPTEADRLQLLKKAWSSVARSAADHFVVVTNQRVRRTPLPRS